MASAEFSVNVLDMPEVVALIRRLRELALEHCDACQDKSEHKAAAIEAAFAAVFEPRS